MNLTWVEISDKALAHNVRVFRNAAGKDVALAPAVKANAYGHGLVETAKALIKAGADWLCVNALYEAETLRESGVKSPILIMGYVALEDLTKAAQLKCDIVVYNPETIEQLGKNKKTINLHLKIETGNHRQGVTSKDIPAILKLIKKYPHLKLVGAYTHFADIEDRVNHGYALMQLGKLNGAIALIEKSGFRLKYRHASSSAAVLVLPEATFNFVRPGVGIYGLWPSEKTKSEVARAAKAGGQKLALTPALTWKTVVAQVKEVEKGASIGYGCTHKMPNKGRIAVLPVGYYDGYVRLLGGKAHVLIKGKKAPVVGRVCMNMIMVDISAIPNVKPEDEVVLLGKQGKLEVTAEDHAAWSQTINYEVTTRINERIPRILKD